MTTHIKFPLNNFLKEKKRKIQEIETISKIIEENLEENFKKHFYIKKIKKNEIIICLDSSCFAFEFNLKKRYLLNEIKKSFPNIDYIRIKTG